MTARHCFLPLLLCEQIFVEDAVEICHCHLRIDARPSLGRLPRVTSSCRPFHVWSCDRGSAMVLLCLRKTKCHRIGLRSLCQKCCIVLLRQSLFPTLNNILGGSSTLMKVLGVCKGSSSWTTMPMNLRIRS